MFNEYIPIVHFFTLYKGKFKEGFFNFIKA